MEHTGGGIKPWNYPPSTIFGANRRPDYAAPKLLKFSLLDYFALFFLSKEEKKIIALYSPIKKNLAAEHNAEGPQNINTIIWTNVLTH